MFHISEKRSEILDCITDWLTWEKTPHRCHAAEFSIFGARAMRASPRLGYCTPKDIGRGLGGSRHQRIVTSHQIPLQKNMVATRWVPSKKCKGGEGLKVGRDCYPSLSERFNGLALTFSYAVLCLFSNCDDIFISMFLLSSIFSSIITHLVFCKSESIVITRQRLPICVQLRELKTFKFSVPDERNRSPQSEKVK